MIIFYLNEILAVAGLQVLHLLEEGFEGGGLLSSPMKGSNGETSLCFSISELMMETEGNLI